MNLEYMYNVCCLPLQKKMWFKCTYYIHLRMHHYNCIVLHTNTAWMCTMIIILRMHFSCAPTTCILSVAFFCWKWHCRCVVLCNSVTNYWSKKPKKGHLIEKVSNYLKVSNTRKDQFVCKNCNLQRHIFHIFHLSWQDLGALQ